MSSLDSFLLTREWTKLEHQPFRVGFDANGKQEQIYLTRVVIKGNLALLHLAKSDPEWTEVLEVHLFSGASSVSGELQQAEAPDPQFERAMGQNDRV